MNQNFATKHIVFMSKFDQKSSNPDHNVFVINRRVIVLMFSIYKK